MIELIKTTDNVTGLLKESLLQWHEMKQGNEKNEYFATVVQPLSEYRTFLLNRLNS